MRPIRERLPDVVLVVAAIARLVGSRFAKHVEPADRDRWLRHARLLRQQGGTGRVELALLGGDGKHFDAQLDCLLASAPAAAPVMRVTLSDINERRRIDTELRLAAAAFETRDGIMITSASGVIERVNQAFTRITGYAREEAVGQPVRLLQSGRHDAAFYAELWDSLQRKGVWEGEVWNRRKSGEVYPQWLAITAVPDDASQVLRYIATMRRYLGAQVARSGDRAVRVLRRADRPAQSAPDEAPRARHRAASRAS